MYLAEAQLAKIRAWAKASPYVDAVRLFGSYAKGVQQRNSVIELLVCRFPFRHGAKRRSSPQTIANRHSGKNHWEPPFQPAGDGR